MLARSILCRLAVCLSVMPAVAAAQADKIPWAKGPTRGALGSEATISVPAGCLFTGVDGVKMFLQLTENIASGNERPAGTPTSSINNQTCTPHSTHARTA